MFVGTVSINAKAALEYGAYQPAQFEMLAVAINAGTNLPSVATRTARRVSLPTPPALAPLIRLSYGRMVWMALPYTIVLTLVGLLCVEFTDAGQSLAAGARLAGDAHLALSQFCPGSPRRINNPLRNIFRRASGVGSVFVYTAMI